jgi:hypothetical protein
MSLPALLREKKWSSVLVDAVRRAAVSWAELVGGVEEATR